MNDDKRIVKLSDGSEKVISIIISFKYEKNNKNYIVYKFVDSEDVLISSFNTVDDTLSLEDISEEEANEIGAVLKETVLGGNK